MSIPNGMEPAFPFQCQGATTWPEIYYGLTLRDYFAAKALQGVLACDEGAICKSTTPEGIQQERVEYAEAMALTAYRYADAMIAERAK